MTDRVTVNLSNDIARARAVRMVESAPKGYYVTISEPTRTLEQNRLMWPLIKDLREQVEHIGRYGANDTKLRFLNALGEEMRFLPNLNEDGMFPVGQRSSTLTKEQFSMLLELMFQKGAEEGVRWSYRSEQAIGSLK